MLDNRSLKQLRQHYDVEKELAQRLRNTTKSDRRSSYSTIYDELFSRVPDHPQLTRKATSTEKRDFILNQLKLLNPILSETMTVIEIGAGDCGLSFEIAKYVEMVIAIDVSRVIASSSNPPDNFKLLISDGVSIPVPDNSIDLAYSYQLMEHLHPEDANEQLTNIFNSLRSGGRYVCVTPNRIMGPHDISKYFDLTAQGLHLKEYTVTELHKLFKQVGFSSIHVLANTKGKYLEVPILPSKMLESLLSFLPLGIRRKIAASYPLRAFLGVPVIAVKE